jgi:hypothetical protein
MPETVNGLPAHVLLVHVVIVLLPLAALLLVVSAVWPLARRKLGVLTPAVALVALVFVPITTSAGEWLEEHVPDSPLVRKHTQLGDSLLPWALGIFVVAAAVWWLGRRHGLTWSRPSAAPSSEPAGAADTTAPGSVMVATRPQRTETRRTGTGRTDTGALPRWVSVVVAVVAIAVSAGGVYQLYRIGDSGAKAAWTGSFSSTSHDGGDGNGG